MQSQTVQNEAVRQEAAQGEVTGVVSTPEGQVGVIEAPPIPTEELCYIRSHKVRDALVPIRCADLVK